MAIHYHVYRNDGAGGPVDYTTIVATVTGLSYLTAALTFPGDWTYAVRAFDTVTGLEEANTETRRRIVLDGAGVDITALPSAPLRLHAEPAAAGTARVTWVYNPANQGGAPTGFKVWLTAGGSVDYGASPATTIPYSAGVFLYTATISGLSDGVAYVVGVRATNATGDEPNTLSFAVTGYTSGPAPVEVLTATSTFLRGD